MRYSQVGDCLTKAEVSLRELRGARGRLILATPGARLAAAAFSGLDENILWSNPTLVDIGELRGKKGAIQNGLGGERLWFGPEYAYNWLGPPDGREFKNYDVQPAYDPGQYVWTGSGDGVLGLKMEADLEDRRIRSRVKFEVQRHVSWAPLPFDPQALGLSHALGICFQHLIHLKGGPEQARVDLWHLLQMPAGSRLLIPTRGAARPLVYFDEWKRNGWQCHADRLEWQFSGNSLSKIGLDTSQATEAAGVLRELPNGLWCAVIWQFTIHPGLPYVDGPSFEKAQNQVVQAWDGFGFGELEYHSPAVGPEFPAFAEASFLWCFAGDRPPVNRAARQILSRDWGNK
jgi:hypothetical protein